MKHLVLTGIASELDVQSGCTSYFLVFNRGELRLPAQESTVEVALAALVSKEDPSDMKAEPDIDWAAEDIQAQAEAGENNGDFYSYAQPQPDQRVVPYQEASPGPSEEDIAAVVASAVRQEWESSNGQLPLDQSDQGANIFSAADDYAQPPPPMSAGVEEINDGVVSI